MNLPPTQPGSNIEKLPEGKIQLQKIKTGPESDVPLPPEATAEGDFVTGSPSKPNLTAELLSGPMSRAVLQQTPPKKTDS